MYDYKTERSGIFTEVGTKRLLKVKDKVNQHLQDSGAFRLQELSIGSWEDMACIDYLVEIGEIVELVRECWGQFRIFTVGKEKK
jgi:hypothetical protein